MGCIGFVRKGFQFFWHLLDHSVPVKRPDLRAWGLGGIAEVGWGCVSRDRGEKDEIHHSESDDHFSAAEKWGRG